MTSTHLRQIVASNSSGHGLPNGQANDEQDDEADLKQYTEHEEDEKAHTRQREKEGISDAGLEIQQALLMEDLLTVIIVSLSSRRRSRNRYRTLIMYCIYL